MARSSKGRPAHGGEEVRLQAYLARAGVASRRASEELIAQGRVFVNGASVTAPGTKVRPGVDRVEVDGEPVEAQPITWVALHKPRGYVTTRHDPYGRRTVYDLIPEKYHGLFHVGRLDRDSEGVLLLTNDGDTANRMLHPAHGVTKEYLADVQGKPASDALRQLVEGVELEDGVAHAESAKRLHQVDENVFRVGVVLREGKKREVRRMLDAVGHPVKRLIRKRFGPVELGELPAGKWRVVLPAELGEITRAKKAPRPRPDAGAPAPSDGDEANPSESRHRASTHGRYSPAAKSASKSGPASKPGPRSASKSGAKSASKAGGRAGAKTAGRSGTREGARSDRPAGAKSGGEGRSRGDSPSGAKSGTRRPSKFTPSPGPRSGSRDRSRSDASDETRSDRPDRPDRSERPDRPDRRPSTGSRSKSPGSTESRSGSSDRAGPDRSKFDQSRSDRPRSDRARSDRPKSDRPRRDRE